MGAPGVRGAEAPLPGRPVANAAAHHQQPYPAVTSQATMSDMSAHQARVMAAVAAAVAEQTALRDRTLAAQAAALGATHAAALAAQAAELTAAKTAAIAAHVPQPVTMAYIHDLHAKNQACIRAAIAGDVKALQHGLAGLTHDDVRALCTPTVCRWSWWRWR